MKVSSEIVTNKSDKQVKILKKFIQVAQYCAELRNFSSLMQILAGINHHCVFRLKKPFMVLPSEVLF